MPTVQVLVSLKPSLLDSAGRTIASSLQNLKFNEVENVRIGKTITLELTEYDPDRVNAMCEQLLANPVIEDFKIEVID